MSSSRLSASCAPHAISERCNWCSRWRLPSSVHRLTTNQVICDQCLDWHFRASDFLGGGEMPEGCQECGADFSTLRDFYPAHARVFVVPKDGIYQMLCARCATPYVEKRADIYGGTQFWKDRKAA